MQQNPDVVLARLDEEKARQGIAVAEGAFCAPKVTVGSGLAYASGFPMSIDGVGAQHRPGLRSHHGHFQSPQQPAGRAGEEDAREAGYASAGKRDDAAYRAAALYLESERAGRLAGLARKEIDNRQSILDTTHAQVAEGRALPLTSRLRSPWRKRSRAVLFCSKTIRDAAETSLLPVALGFPAEDRVTPANEDRPAPEMPASPDAAIQSALESNKELRQLQSQVASKQIEMRAERASKWPRADLVAQYGLFAKFNNYSQYFNSFQRNNGEIGASFRIAYPRRRRGERGGCAIGNRSQPHQSGNGERAQPHRHRSSSRHA